jgi:hypothetical protein
MFAILPIYPYPSLSSLIPFLFTFSFVYLLLPSFFFCFLSIVSHSQHTYRVRKSAQDILGRDTLAVGGSNAYGSSCVYVK